MKFNTAIYEEYRKFVITSLNETLQETKEVIKQNSLYRYGDLDNKLRVIEELKEDFAGSHFNFLKVKGIEYSKGEFQINDTEFKDLIIQYQVNLENSNFGLFENHNDNEKPLALKSFIQVLSILTYCLQLQILNEEKNYLFKGPNEIDPEYLELENYKHPIFKTAIDEAFFLNIIEEPGKHKRKFISCLYASMIGRLKVNQSEFAVYWNTHYSEIYKIREYSKNRFGIDTPPNKEPLKIEIDQKYIDFKRAKEQ